MQPWTFTTPEQVVFRRFAAGLGSRAAAWSLDQLILLIVFLVMVGTLGKLSGAGEFARGLVQALIFILYFLLNFGYCFWFELFRQGQTPGKKILGLRVISAHGGVLKPQACLLRSVARALDSPMPFFAPIALVVMACDPWHRRMGDFLGGTLVVADTKKIAPALLEGARTRHNSFAQDLQIKARILARASRADRDLLADLLDRRDALDGQARDLIFQEACATFSKRYELPQTNHLSDEQTVLNVALIVLEDKFVG